MKEKKKKNNLRILFFFCLFVLVIIVVSFFFQFIQTLQKSKFDGDHFTISFVSSKPSLDIVSLNLKNKTASYVQVRNFQNLEEAKKMIGIFTDANINLAEPFDVQKDLSFYFLKSFLQMSSNTDLSWYDLIRLVIATREINTASFKTKVIKLPLESILIDQALGELFYNNLLSEENKTIEIVNGTGIAGLGGRLERVLSNLGANIIAVRNAEKIQDKSQILYFGDKSYTSSYLSRMLGIKEIMKQERGLSDIIIIIGKDTEKGISY